jgi:hypothetical protein
MHVVCSQIIEDDQLARVQLWRQDLFDEGEEHVTSVGDSMLMLASTPSVVRAAKTIRVRQWPAGTASRTRSERGPQP